MPISLRADYTAGIVRLAAKKTKNGRQAQRLLALAAINEGASRTEAARLGGVNVQIVRDWVFKFNADGRSRRGRSLWILALRTVIPPFSMGSRSRVTQPWPAAVSG